MLHIFFSKSKFRDFDMTVGAEVKIIQSQVA